MIQVHDGIHDLEALDGQCDWQTPAKTVGGLGDAHPHGVLHGGKSGHTSGVSRVTTYLALEKVLKEKVDVAKVAGELVVVVTTVEVNSENASCQSRDSESCLDIVEKMASFPLEAYLEVLGQQT